MVDLIEKLGAIVGADNVLTMDGDTAPFCMDWRGRYRGRTAAVARPGSTDEVARIVRACTQAHAPIVPQGGNTGLVGGGTPDGSGRAVVLSLKRMNRVRSIDTVNDAITVEAGCVLQAVQDAARAQERLFPLSLAAEGSCTIGGNLSTNAGGTQVLRYGSTRDLALGLEVVLPSGEVWQGLRGLRKDNTGYDLKHLFIGAEGTLGVITAATLKLFPLPLAQVTALAALPSLAAAVGLLAAARAGAGQALTAFEAMAEVCLRQTIHELPQLRAPLLRDAPWYVLLELSDHESEAHATVLLERILSDAVDAGLVFDAAIARSIAQARALWAIREGIPEAQAKAGGNVKHDISLPVSSIVTFVGRTNARLARRFPWILPIVFGHLGDGNLHYNVGTRAGVPAARVFTHQIEINRIVYDAVQAAGGSISAEHGVGQLKRDEIARRKPSIELATMRAIKAMLDPLGLMNPGKVLQESPAGVFHPAD